MRVKMICVSATVLNAEAWRGAEAEHIKCLWSYCVLSLCFIGPPGDFE